jgi:hypothetical protein
VQSTASTDVAADDTAGGIEDAAAMGADQHIVG